MTMAELPHHRSAADTLQPLNCSARQMLGAIHKSVSTLIARPLSSMTTYAKPRQLNR
jgi:hypothetical protein